MNEIRAGSQRATAIKDLIIIFFSVILVQVLSSYFEVHERLDTWLYPYEHLQLDEFLIVLATLSVAFGIFSLRRWRELQAEIRAHREAMVVLHRQSLAFENVSDSIILADLQGFIVDCNPATERIFGYPQAELLGKHLIFWYKPQDSRQMLAEIREGLQHGTGWSGELSFVRKDEREGEVEVVMVPAYDDQRQPTALVSVARDVTERKQAAVALHQSEERLRAIFNGAALGIALEDLEGRLIEFNPAFQQMLGYSAEEMCCRHFAEFTHPEDVELSMESNLALRAGKINHYQIEKRYLRKDGEVVWVRLTVAPAFSSGGELAYFVGMTEDITGRRQAEEQLQRQALVFEHMSENVVLTDARGLITDCNAAAERDFGYSKEELIGKPPSLWHRPEDSPAILASIYQALQGGFLWSDEINYVHKDGGEGIMEVVVLPVHDEHGHVVATIGVGRDVTERKQAEAALRESDVRYRAVVETALDAIISSDSEGKIVSWNTGAQNIFGYTEDEALGQSSSIIIPTRYRDAHNLGMERIRSTGESHIIGTIQEFSGLRKDGGEFPLELSFARWKTGAETFYTSIMRDVTERKRAEEELRKQALVFESLTESVILIDNLGRIVDCNPATVKMYGYSKEELIGKHPDILHKPEDRHEFPIKIVEGLLYESGWSGETHFVRNDGSEGIRELTTRPVCDSQGQAVSAIAVSRDITERRRAEMELRRSEARNRAFLESIPDAIFQFQRDGTITDFQPANNFVLLVPPETLLGKSVVEVLPANVAQPALKEFAKALDTGEMQVWDYQLAEVDGFHDYEARCVPLGDDEVLVIVRETTERRRAEQESLHRKVVAETLVRIASHLNSELELESLLGVICRETAQALNVPVTTVSLYDREREQFVLAAAKGLPDEVLVRFAPLSRAEYDTLLQQRGTTRMITPNVQTLSTLVNADLYKAIDMRTTVSISLLQGNEPVGRLNIATLGTPREFTEEELALLQGIAHEAAIAISNAQLFEDLQQANVELAQAYDTTIEGWSRALDLRDKETEGHSQRVTEMAMRLARAMGMSEDELVHVRRGSLLHDIGKMGVPDAILLKPGKLTDEEWEIMRLHPVYGYTLLEPITFLRPALDVPYSHHEKWDGSGYPQRLRGEQIPLAARIFAIVDVWDALRSDRPYRAGWPAEKALAHILDQSGTHFDPEVVEAFMQMIGPELEDPVRFPASNGHS